MESDNSNKISSIILEQRRSIASLTSKSSIPKIKFPSSAVSSQNVAVSAADLTRRSRFQQMNLVQTKSTIQSSNLSRRNSAVQKKASSSANIASGPKTNETFSEESIVENLQKPNKFSKVYDDDVKETEKAFTSRKESRRSSIAPGGVSLGAHVALGTLARLNMGNPPTRSGTIRRQSVALQMENNRPSSITSNKNTEEAKKINDQMLLFYHSSSKPLQGAVTVQMLLHYFTFVVILVSANVSWSPDIRLEALSVYCTLFIAIYELSRCIYHFDSFSVVPIYLSIAPFFAICFSSREAHMLIMVLWYVSTFCVLLQVGSAKLHWHLFFFSFLLLAIYLGCVLTIQKFYVCQGGPLRCVGSDTTLESSVNWLSELTLSVGIFHLVFNGMALERFIKEFALAYLERETYLESMAAANYALRKELKRLNKVSNNEFTSPMVHVIELLKNIRETSASKEDIETIEKAVVILASDQLFVPSLAGKQIDREIGFFLQNLLQTTEKENTNDGDGSNSNAKSDEKIKMETLPEVEETSLKSLLLADNLSNDLTTNAEALKILEEMDSPLANFNVLALKKIDIRCLETVLLKAIMKLGCSKKFNIFYDPFITWIRKIEEGYVETNPYHNSTHAADVVYMMYFFLSRPKFQNKVKYTDEEVLGALLATAIHDFKHPGLNNAFHVNTLDRLALRYNDAAVLEHYHLASAFEVMMDPSCNFFKHLSAESKKRIREIMVSLVLSTDMASHFEWIGKFKNRVISDIGFDWNKPADRCLVLNIAMKASDVNNATKPFSMCLKWTEMITEEFFRQGDEEKKRGLAISTFMNRENADIPKSQVAFIDYIVRPLYEPWITFFTDELKVLGDNINANREIWKSRAERSTLPVFQPSNIATIQSGSKLKLPPIVASTEIDDDISGEE